MGYNVSHDDDTVACAYRTSTSSSSPEEVDVGVDVMRLSLPESFPNYRTLRESVEEQVRIFPLSFLPSSSPPNPL